MNIPMGICTSLLMCAAASVSAGHDGVQSSEIGKPTMALTIQATETNVTEMRSDAYRRHVSQAQEYLASRPVEPDTPTF